MILNDNKQLYSMLELQCLMKTNKALAEKKKQMHAEKAKRYAQKYDKLQQLLIDCAEDDREQISGKLKALECKMRTEEGKLAEILSIEKEINDYINTEQQDSRSDTSLTESVLRQPLSDICNNTSSNTSNPLFDEKMYLQGTVSQLQRQIRDHTYEVSMLKRQAISLKRDNHTVMEQLCSHRHSLSSKQHQVSLLTQQLTDLTASLTTLKAEHSSYQEKCRQERQEHSRCMRELQQLQCERSAHREQMERQRKEWEGQREQWERQRKEWEGQREQWEGQYREMRGKYERMQLEHGEMEEIVGEKDRLHREVSEISERLGRVVRTVEESEGYLRGLREDIEEKEKELEGIVERRREVLEEVSNHQQSLKNIEKSIEEMMVEEDAILKRISKVKAIERKLLKK